jgi:metal-sulfur cluster biosynthetic enzyme
MELAKLGMLITDEAIETEAWDLLREVYDPEIGINLVDLGLIYDLSCEQGTVHVNMTLTTPGCPMSDSMPPAVQRALEPIPGVRTVSVDLIWDPPWDPERISRQARGELGWFD